MSKKSVITIVWDFISRMMFHAIAFAILLYILSASILSVADGSLDPFRGYLSKNYIIGYLIAGIFYYFIKVRWLDQTFRKPKLNKAKSLPIVE